MNTLIRPLNDVRRTLDIDLLFYGDLVLQEPELVLPHPRLHLRLFVLAPLAEVASQLIHPLLGRTARQMLGDLSDSGDVQRLPGPW